MRHRLRRGSPAEGGVRAVVSLDVSEDALRFGAAPFALRAVLETRNGCPSGTRPSTPASPSRGADRAAFIGRLRPPPRRGSALACAGCSVATGAGISTPGVGAGAPASRQPRRTAAERASVLVLAGSEDIAWIRRGQGERARARERGTVRDRRRRQHPGCSASLPGRGSAPSWRDRAAVQRAAWPHDDTPPP